MGPHILGVQPLSFEMSPFPEIIGPPPHFRRTNVILVDTGWMDVGCCLVARCDVVQLRSPLFIPCQLSVVHGVVGMAGFLAAMLIQWSAHLRRPDGRQEINFH